MGTEERPDRPAGARARSSPSSARRRIPLPPLPDTPRPAFRKEAGQAPVEGGVPSAVAANEQSTPATAQAKPETPPVDRHAERPATSGVSTSGVSTSGVSTSGVSDEETDLLLGGGPLDGALEDEFESLIGGEAQDTDLPTASAATTPATVPTAGERPEWEASDRSPDAQATESGVAPPPERPGAPGSEVLNDLVEEIEKDLEEEVIRLTLQSQKMLPTYRKTIPCSFVPVARPDAQKKRLPRADS